LRQLQLDFSRTAYIGDDLPDLACIRRVALGVAVPGAHETVRAQAFCTTTLPGGHGAVREVCDWILKAQGNFAAAVAAFE
jgi:3-deoxy-D-manno-octulosonate 8-phosphate phosphatase (KDO 8-P phosphatase)